ncbi:sugar phosphate isomerase/epimerase [Agromyces intestinalis]|uniref:Sugar phosphate isomerase/epimerase n=1 Tax=Agromyces intestinalis TaxID=2592652 RepID=A0A5C1YCD8_9MICO|nr:sugar phosphate isomerase/epimerase family protein [Agromyces intestinalis]QEO13753.1 sugar phosphate isomerase/epimerase [Agromyces intestinalis]
MSTPHPRLSMNQGTIKHSTLDEALGAVAGGGYESIGLWREPVHDVGLAEAARRLTASGLRFSTLCRGGFFTMGEGPARRAQLDDNRRAIEETATLASAGAPGSAAVYVLVAGGLPEGSRDLIGARSRVQDALAELAPEAEAAGVTMAIEPLHPMFASDRCVVTTLKQALDLAEPFDPSVVGVTVDTFHIWWDPEVLPQIARAGASGRIATYQVCDWKTPLPANVLNSRHYPGDGVIDFATLTRAVEAAGYAGDVEVEIFNDDVFATPFDEVVARTAETFGAAVAPHLAATPAPAPARA